MRVNRWLVLAGVVGLLTVVAPEAASQQAPKEPIAEFGEVFPAATFENLNEGTGGAATIDLTRTVGKRPVILYYWVAGNAVADSAFLELQALADEVGPAKLVLYGVVTERPGLGREQILERARALKIRVPLLNDEGFKIGQQLQVRSVPSISILDAEGKLRLTNAGSLRQPLEYKMDVEAAIRRVGEMGTLGTYGAMPKWYPVNELVGEPCPDFEAPLLGNGELRSRSQFIDPEKINVLVFWSVDCPHCRKELPELNKWLKGADADYVNFVGAARVSNETIRIKTEEFCDYNGIVFPNVVDQDHQIGDRFRIVSTPTFVIVGPDGVIDSVVVSGDTDLAAKLEAKKKELLKAGT